MGRQFGKWFAEANAHFEHKRDGSIVRKAYRDSNGVWTGPGGRITHPDGSPVKEGDEWSLEDAVAIYNEGKQDFAEHVEKVLRGSAADEDLNPKISPMQFDGLGLLCWNIGKAAFARSTLVNELRAGHLEAAAEAALMWKGDTLHGGRNGPDGKLVRGPDNAVLPQGVAWFKLFRGIYRRSMWAALLLLKRDPSFAADSNNIKLAKETTTRGPDYFYDVMIKEESTSLREALDHSAAVVEAVPKPVVQSDVPSVPTDWQYYTDSEKVAWLNTGTLRQLQKKGGDPVSPQVVPAAKRPSKAVRPLEQVEYLSEEAKAAPKVKKVGKSKRGNAFANKKIGGVMGGATVAAMAADQIGAVEPVLKAADKYGTQTIGYVLLAGLVLAGLVYAWGVILQRWGEDDADTVLE